VSVRPLFVANWKMNKLPGEGREFVAGLAKALGGNAKGADVVIAPPAPLIPEVGAAISELAPEFLLGAQNCHWLSHGAHTGEISGELLARLGVKFAIVGHSERRQLYREPNNEVALRVMGAREREISPILCIGETREQFENGNSVDVVLQQLRQSLEGVPVDSPVSIAIGYEPVWAIGTGLAATPEIAAKMHSAIRAELTTLGYDRNVRIVYGGSTTPENVRGFMSSPDVNGALVGGASLDSAKFGALVLQGIAKA